MVGWMLPAIFAFLFWGLWGLFPKLAAPYLDPWSIFIYARDHWKRSRGVEFDRMARLQARHRSQGDLHCVFGWPGGKFRFDPLQCGGIKRPDFGCRDTDRAVSTRHDLPVVFSPS